MKKKTTELVFVIDKSSSMSGLEADTIKGFNAMLKAQQELVHENSETFITTFLFDSKCTLLHDRLDIDTVAPLTKENYLIGGGTALLDAFGTAMHKIRKVQESIIPEYRSQKILFVIITDGQENCSRHYTYTMIKDRVEKYKKMGWEFEFFGANIDTVFEAGKLGIDTDMAHDCISDANGIRATYSMVSDIISDFRSGENLYAANALKGNNAVNGLKHTIDETIDLLSPLAKNGGKFPDVNKMVADVVGSNIPPNKRNCKNEKYVIKIIFSFTDIRYAILSKFGIETTYNKEDATVFDCDLDAVFHCYDVLCCFDERVKVSIEAL